MRNQRIIHPSFITFGIPVLLLASATLMALNLNIFGANKSSMSMALTLDLVLTTPIVYFFLIRNKKIPKTTVVPFFIIGLVIATFIIPPDQQQTLNNLKLYLLPVVEITVFTLVFLKVRKAITIYKKTKKGNADIINVIDEVTQALFPKKVANAVRTEIGLFYFGLYKWRKPKYEVNEFSYHKDNGTLVLLGTLLFACLIELFVVHLLLQNATPILSWVLSILSAYGVLQIFGLMKSIPHTPIQITDTEVILRMGLFQVTKIPLTKIEKFEMTISDYDEEDKSFQKITFFGHNAIIHLNEDETLYGLFGVKKTFRHLVVSIDEKERFAKLLNEKRAEYEA